MTDTIQPLDPYAVTTAQTGKALRHMAIRAAHLPERDETIRELAAMLGHGQDTGSRAWMHVRPQLEAKGKR